MNHKYSPSDPEMDRYDRYSKFGNNRRRRTAILRFLALAVVVWFCYHTIFTWSERLEALESAEGKLLALMNTTLRATGHQCPNIDSSRTSSSVEENVTQKKTSAAYETVKAQDGPQTPLNAPPPHAFDPELGSRNGFKEALYHALSLLPDELHVRDLLRPIEGTGEEMVREIGLRTRSFKTLFEAWEALHLVEGSDGMYIRDDVVQYLRRNPKLADEFQMDLAQLIRSYETFRSIMARLSTLLFPYTAPYFSDHITLHAQLHGGGRGLVFTAGDNQAPFLLTSIPAMRELGCDLPVEVFYLGDDDLSEDFRNDLEAIPGVITRDLSQMVNDKGWALAGWAAKPFAILLSSFREAIFIDADSLFFTNPAVLFEDHAYISTGALFFKDRLIMPESKKRWLQKILPKPISKKVTQSRFWTGESGHMQESGVVVVDKWKHFVALLLVTRLNGPDRDGNQSTGKVGVYDMVYGDKETFWISWELVGDLHYAFHDGDAGIMGVLEKDPATKTASRKSESTKGVGEDEEDHSTFEDVKDTIKKPDNYTICAPQLLHLDREGRPLWFNGWLLPNKFEPGKDQVAANFEAFLPEPREVREPTPWQLMESNVCCLTANYYSEFTREERDVLEMIIDLGRRSGALNKMKS